MEILISIVLGIALVTGSITDIRNQRIYNWLTFPLILAGLATHTVFGGFAGLKFAAAGFAVGFVLMAIPYFFGAMGAGDVKLMAGIGAWLGMDATFLAFLFTCIAGGGYCIVVLLRDPSLFKRVMRNIWNAFSVFIATRKMNFAPSTSGAALPRLCYGVAIAIGTAAAMTMFVWQTGSIYVGY
ncbi:A24 family peptidase [uncultured Pseudodesulfovibrio sp.]|uniref:A24 family peptidase n=1 Tax=uncultured Pseudodesulfovibrio sp. TaxID=2035858 RepID=UPI0029C78195|nr:A24 family peptidase [uncultured Pseudodesulfovibrio sp.]